MKAECYWCAVAVAALAVVAHADIEMTVKDGGSVVTESEPGAFVYMTNEGSTLVRSLITLDDTDSPVALVDSGLAVQSHGDWYGPIGSAHPRMPISAFEIRFVLFDVFGNHLATLSRLQIKDFDAGTKVPLSEKYLPLGRVGWQAGGTIRRLLTVVSFVAQVRTRDGLVWQYDERAIVESLLDLNLASTPLTDLEEKGGDD